MIKLYWYINHCILYALINNRQDKLKEIYGFDRILNFYFFEII